MIEAGVARRFNVPIPLRDGVMLSADLALLGTGGDMITETEGAIAMNRLWHTPSRPSRLILN